MKLFYREKVAEHLKLKTILMRLIDIGGKSKAKLILLIAIIGIKLIV